MSTYRCSAGKRHRPVTVAIGLALIVTCEILLFCVDLPARQWAVVPLPPGQVLEPPRGFWQVLARSVAINITPVCWVGYLLVADGVLELNSTEGAISVGNDANAFAINVGTGGAARTVTVGNATAASKILSKRSCLDSAFIISVPLTS